MDNLQAIAAIIGLVNGVRLFQTDKVAFGYFALAVGLGVVFGLLHLFGLNLETGLVAALASSGFYQVAKKVGGQ